MKETKESRPRGVLSNAGWNAFATTISIAVTMLLAPVLIRHLGTDQWGMLLLVWSVTGVLGVANFGVGEATLRFVAHYHADGDLVSVNRVMGATLTFYLSICTVVVVILFAGAPFLIQWVKVPASGGYPVDWLLRLAGLLFAVGMVTNAFRSIPMALQRYDISSRIGLAQTIVRPLGFIFLALAGRGVVDMVIWDLFVALVVLGVNVIVARHFLPGIQWLPTMSFIGLREIFGYSVYSFLTHIFLTIYREGGKLILGSRVGAASVAYLGTPDSVAHRLHTVVVSGIETLMPRFSASRDAASREALLVTATWIAVTCGVVLYLPLAILMPDFLRLWINPLFARESSAVGQLLALSFVAPTAFAPMATLLRGLGKPGFVTVVMAVAGLVVLACTLMLVSSYGVLAVGVGYALSSFAWLAGLAVGWVQVCKSRPIRLLLRVAGVPLLLGLGLGMVEHAFRNWLAPLGWVGLFAAGASYAGVNALVLLGVDHALGGDSPAGQIFARILRSERIMAVQRYIGIPAQLGKAHAGTK